MLSDWPETSYLDFMSLSVMETRQSWASQSLEMVSLRNRSGGRDVSCLPPALISLPTACLNLLRRKSWRGISFPALLVYDIGDSYSPAFSISVRHLGLYKYSKRNISRLIFCPHFPSINHSRKAFYLTSAVVFGRQTTPQSLRCVVKRLCRYCGTSAFCRPEFTQSESCKDGREDMPSFNLHLLTYHML
jgi:hypothetical protein